MVRSERIRVILNVPMRAGSVVYWMSRDQRADDNWALIYARQMAIKLQSELSVVFCLVPSFMGATQRQYGFMIRSLSEVKTRLENLGITFHLLIGNPWEKIPEFIIQNGVSVLVTDFDPLRIKLQWKEKIKNKIQIAFHEVDAHNIVPCWHTSSKVEFGAYTIRPKIARLLPLYLDEFTELTAYNNSIKKGEQLNTDFLLKKLCRGINVSEVNWIVPGERASMNKLNEFIENKLSGYHLEKNDPNKDACSGLSPYLHFGQLSAQRVAMEIIKRVPKSPSLDDFLEELIIRRELSDNYCYYNPHYDLFEGFPAWAKLSLDSHRSDKREFIYNLNTFEEANTHDRLWNAAQNQMKKSGKMHGYMRMYWAKKILEWTSSPEDAIEIAIFLNDKYELDGRDPNGYAGCAWSIGGVHDRAWANKPVIGKIRYMNFNGAKRKFDVENYIRKWGKV